MCGKRMNLMKVCGKMLNEARLEKIGVQVNERVIYYKYLNFKEVWKIPCVVKNFPVLYLNSPCFPCLEKVMTKFSVFPAPSPP